MSVNRPAVAGSPGSTTVTQGIGALVFASGSVSGSANCVIPDWVSGTFVKGQMTKTGGRSYFCTLSGSDTTGPLVNTSAWKPVDRLSGGITIKNTADPGVGVQTLYYACDAAVTTTAGVPVNAGGADSGAFDCAPHDLFVIGAGSYCLVGLAPSVSDASLS